MLGLKIEVRVNVTDNVTMCHQSFSVLVLVDKFNQILPSLSYYRLRAVLASAEFPRNFVFDHSVFVSAESEYFTIISTKSNYSQKHFSLQTSGLGGFMEENPKKSRDTASF